MRVLLAVSTRREVIDQILTHVKVPRELVPSDELAAPYLDVTGESVSTWALGVDPDPDDRGVLRCSRPRRGSSEGRLRGVIPAV
ncbi:MAG TPA: hypothetical protein PLI95_15995 [Polyangiaceae bacterium]|nr:hypothetical protein [Polyangiaceae bacterium]